ncbi:MFS transporter [Micromonospora acroterricola]|uniref:MFS transporter n=1 Tax=Micromonospora acroterricola TaxID=2202421 RepID=A0A317CS72_9ACTN|nr:MFS transporter [Micromonospora acroterricola]PWR05401.1 MFS transporter [Micromonospora acroterricola]
MFTLLRHRGFVLIWAAGLFSGVASWLLLTGLPIYVFGVTGSAFTTSAVFLVELLCGITLGSFAGALADRFDRFRLMGCVAVVQAAVVIPLLAEPGHHLWIICLVAGAQAVLTQTFDSARNAALPSLVEPVHLVGANSMVALNISVGRLIGSSLGGLAITLEGTRYLAVGGAVAFVITAALIAAGRRAVRHGAAESTPPGRTSPFFANWRSGLAAMLRNRTVRVTVLSVALGGIAQGLFVVLFVVFVSRALHADGTLTGVLRGVQAIGGVAGGLIVGMLGTRLSPRLLMSLGATTFGLISLVIWNGPAATRQPEWYILLFILVGVPGIAYNSGAFAQIQQGVPDTDLGRAFGAYYAIYNTSQGLGMAAAGLLGDLLSVVLVLNVQAALYLVSGVVAYVGLRSVGGATPPSTSGEPFLIRRHKRREVGVSRGVRSP